MTSGNRPVPEQGSWQIPGAASAYHPVDEPARSGGRGRPLLAGLVVALVELVIIGAACNQSVSKHALRYSTGSNPLFLRRAVGSVLEFQWRFTPLDGDNTRGFHLYDSQLLTIAVFVVLSALLAALAVGGTVTFWRAFVAIWTGVVAAACVGRVVGALVTKSLSGQSERVTGAVFLTLSGATVFFAAVVGLITALVATLVAVATRRTAPAVPVASPPAEPAYQPEAPPPFYGTPQQAQPQPPEPQQAERPQAEPQPQPQPQQQAGSEDADGRTTQLPRFDPRGGKNWTPPSDGGATQAMPAAPDDDR